jgi:Glycosyl transferases group 1
MDYVMDMSLIEEVVRRRPQWHWAMIGLKSNLITLEAPNLHFLTPKAYSELPAYVRHFDICILPWHQNHPFTRYGSAIKVREYLATGKPIVMSPLYEYEGTPGVRFFRNANEFIAAIEAALTNDTAADRALRQSVVRHATWDEKTWQYAAVIKSVLAAKATGSSVDFDHLRQSLGQSRQRSLLGEQGSGDEFVLPALDATAGAATEVKAVSPGNLCRSSGM